jgi:hypothetical protein
MWCASVHSTINSLRRPGGSLCDPDVGISSRSASAALIDALKRALHEHPDDLSLNLALGQVEQAIWRWRAENPEARPEAALPLGRPSVLDGDVERLLALRAANPGSGCRREFERWTGAGKQRARIRYRDANARA